MLGENTPAQTAAGPPELKYDVCICHHVVVGFKEQLNSEEQDVNAGHHMDYYATERADRWRGGHTVSLTRKKKRTKLVAASVLPVCVLPQVATPVIRGQGAGVGALDPLAPFVTVSGWHIRSGKVSDVMNHANRMATAS